MKPITDKIRRFSQDKPTYSAYPIKEQKMSGNTDTISVDTVEKTLRLGDKKATNKSIN